jgi:catecholate siderophore receptor
VSVDRSGAAAAKAPLFLALSCVAFISSPALADDLDTGEADQSSVQQRTESDIVIIGERGAQELESPKATSELVDTPQTVTVISDQTLQRQNLLTLRDALTTIPGITFGAGEGGGGYGDSINLRGYSASNDITQDGVRDSAQYSRTDPFNLQQIEIYNGANSVFNGSGSVGGTINLVSKVPQSTDLAIVSAAVGTDQYYRATADINRLVSDGVAVRLNAMGHRNDLPGRDFESNRRWGIAPAVTFGVSSPTSLTVAYFHQQDDNVPVYGVPYFLNQLNNGPLPEADDSDYFGYRNLDEQDLAIHRVTATIRHEFSDRISLRGLTRWQRVDAVTIASAPQGTYCLTGTGRQPVSAGPDDAVGLACPAGLNPGFFRPSGPHGRVRDQVNDLVHSQADLRVESGAEGRLHNILVVGASLSWEDYRSETADLARNPDGSAFSPLPIESISNPAAVYSGPINYTVTARSRGDYENRAIYAFDTLELGSMFELNGGIRLEQADGLFQNEALAAYPPGTTPLAPQQLVPQVSEETLFSYRFGGVFHPAQNVSLYAAFANSKTPSVANVRTDCTSGSGATFVNFCGVAPETARSYEIGAKAELFRRRLQLTAALFRNERSNYRVPSNDPTDPAALQVLDGRARVDGLALGASGFLAEGWSIFANYTYLDSEVLQSVSDFCLANPGSAGCANSVAIPDPQAGDRLLQTPRHSGSLFTTYELPFGLQVGYGLTYQGSFPTHQRNLLQRTQYFADDFLIHRAFLSYAFANGMTAQLNVQNLTDERYFTSIRNNVNATSGAITGGWAAPGEGRSAVLSLFYSF